MTDLPNEPAVPSPEEASESEDGEGYSALIPLTPPEVVIEQLAKAKKISQATLYAIVGMTLAGMTAVVVLFLMDKTEGASVILTMLTPTITALLAYRKSTENAAAIHEVHLSVNGRLSQLLRKTEHAAKAQGKLEAAETRKFRATDTTDDIARVRSETKETPSS